MRVLGLGGSAHDLSCCLLENGRIIRAVEEERLSKEKYADGPKSQLYHHVEYCLDHRKIDEVDLIIGNDAIPLHPLINKKIVNHIIKINHHLAHAASSYYTSGFENAAILVIDGAGSRFLTMDGVKLEHCSYGYAEGCEIDLFRRYYSVFEELNCKVLRKSNGEYERKLIDCYPESLGQFYSFFTRFCGFERFQEGKLMGLSSYGSDRYVSALKPFIKIDMPATIDLALNSPDFIGQLNDIMKTDKNRDLFQVRADFAYAVQHVFEEAVFQVMNYVYEKTRCKNLAYAGGSAMNSVLNGKIKKRTPFENVSIFAGANDSGTAIGAALYGQYNILKKRYQPRSLSQVFFGKTYSRTDIEEQIKRYSHKLEYQSADYPDLYQQISKEISRGKIIGWFQDGCEYGPRALGNRSILADPRGRDMKDILNQRVKFRESFRPFAPVVLAEHVNEYFDTDFEENPFMLFVGEVKKNKRDQLPAVTHVDGSARLQTLSPMNNQKLYSLIQEFYRLTGIPVLLNTSFNIKGLPIVEFPRDALKAFCNSDMDILVMDNYIITKRLERENDREENSQENRRR